MSTYNGQESIFIPALKPVQLNGAEDEGTCEHEGTDVDGDGGTHAITGRTKGTRKLTTDKDG